LLDGNHSDLFVLHLEVGSGAVLYKCEEAEEVFFRNSSKFRMRWWSEVVRNCPCSTKEWVGNWEIRSAKSLR